MGLCGFPLCSFALFLLRILQTIDLIHKNLNKNRKDVFKKNSKKRRAKALLFLDEQSYSIIIRLEVSAFSFLGSINVKTPSSNLA